MKLQRKQAKGNNPYWQSYYEYNEWIDRKKKKKKSAMGLYIFWLVLSKHCPAKLRQDSLTWKRVSFITAAGNDLSLWKCGCDEILMALVALTSS